MTQTTKIEMTANDQGVLAALDKQGRAMDKLADKLMKVEKAGERGSGKVKSGFDQAGKAITGAAQQLLGFGSVLGGIGLLVTTIKKEMEDLRRRDQEAKASQMTAGEAVRAARINFVPDASLQDKDLEAALQKVADKTRTPIGSVATAFGSAASAKGSLTNSQAMQAVEAAFTLQPGNLGTGVELGSRSLDIAKLAPGISPQAAVGFMLNLQSAARVTELPRLGANAPSAIAASAALGDTPEQGAELFATMTSLLSDAMGSVSATAQKTLVSRLSEFVPTLAGKDAKGEFTVPIDQLEAFNAVTNPTARMEVLQKSPELRRDFLARNPFGAEVSVGIERLLSGEAGALAEFQQARQVINPLDARQEEAFTAKLAELEGGQFQPVLTAQQQTAQLKEQALLSNSLGGLRAASRDALLSGMDAAGMPWMDRKAAEWRFDLTAGKQPVETAINQLQGQIENQRVILQNGPGWGAEGASRESAAAAIPVLEQQLKILQDLRDDSRRRDPPAQRREPAQQALGRR